MSVQDRPKRLSVTQVRSRKGGDKLVCLTAYTASVARLVDHEVDLLLVGDSLAMTVYGFASTLPIGLDTMIAHGAAVVRSTEQALVRRRSAVRQLSGLACRRLSCRRTGPRRDRL